MKRPLPHLTLSSLALFGLVATYLAVPTVQTGVSLSAPRFDAWRILGPGGGGAQFYPAVSPHDPNLVLVACDMTGAYISENGGQSWRLFDLRSPVTFFAFDPQDPRSFMPARTPYGEARIAAAPGVWSTLRART